MPPPFVVRRGMLSAGVPSYRERTDPYLQPIDAEISCACDRRLLACAVLILFPVCAVITETYPSNARGHRSYNPIYPLLSITIGRPFVQLRK